jgi:hypothetical protein
MNGHNVESTTAGDEVQLQRRRHQDGFDSDGGSSGISFFEPWTEPATRGGRGSSGHGPRIGGGYKTAEKRMIRFALQLAVLEKAASMLGKLAFVWATVVLLGGFASSLSDLDFWSMTVILVGEGARVFGRGNELQWQRHSTARSSAGSSSALRVPGSRFCRRVLNAIAIVPSRAGVARPVEGEAAVVGAHGTVQVVVPLPHAVAEAEQRVRHTPDDPPLPYTGWVIVSKNAGVLLNSLQVLSSVACVALSVIGLCNCRQRSRSVDEARNQRPALVLFYSLALAEAALFLLEKAYWTWKVLCCGLLDEISSECELGACGLVALTRFFYDAYSQCIGKSIFDGVKMDLVTFAKELIESDFLDEQLIGVRILRQFARSKSSAPETLRKVGTSARSIERLVEMLNWKSPEEEEVRRGAAEVVSKLVGKSQNALRVAGIHGC